jgi:hypothetical protein
MATLYCIGSPASATASWSTSSGGASAGVTPYIHDDIIFDANSPSCSITSALYCRSADFLNYVYTLTLGGGIGFYIGDTSTTATNGSLALRLGSGMTLTLGSVTSSLFVFQQSTGSPALNITVAGKTLAGVTFTSGSYVLVDGFTTSSLATVTLTAGTLNTNNQTCSWGLFNSSNSNTRALTLGTSAITLTGAAGTIWNINTPVGLTLSAISSTITLAGATATFLGGGAPNYGTVNFTGSGVATLGNSGGQFVNLTRIGTTAPTDSFVVGSIAGSTFTVSGTFTTTGNAVGVRLLVQSFLPGTAKAIQATATSLTNADFQDIAASGTATWTGTSIGDCQGNSGITFDASRTLYAVGTTGAVWNVTSTWATTSGGASGSNPPLPQDDVVIDANTVSVNTSGYPRLCRSLTQSTSKAVSGAGAPIIFGSLSIQGANFNTSLTLAGRAATGTTSMAAGQTITGTLTVNAPGGTYTATSSLSMTGAFTTTAGTFTAQANVTAANFSLGASSTVNMGSGTWQATGSGSGSIWGGAATINCGTSTIVFPSNPTVAQAFLGQTRTYYNLTLAAGSVVTFSGNNTFNQLTVPPGAGVLLTAGSTNIVTQPPVATGQSFGYQHLPGVSGNYFSSPSAAPVQLGAAFTIDVRCSLMSFAAQQGFVGRWGLSGSYSYWLFMNSGGFPVLDVSTNGTAYTTAVSSATLASAGITTNTPFWLRSSYSSGSTNFYTSTDGATWTKLGNTIATATGTPVVSAQILEVGSNAGGTTNLFAGNMYEVKLYQSTLGTASGTASFDANFTTKALGANSFTESSTNAATVSIIGLQAQIGDGRVQLGSTTNGTAATLSKASGTVSLNYLVLQDVAATGGASWYAGGASVDGGNNVGWNFNDVPLLGTAALSTTASLTAAATVRHGRGLNVTGSASLTGNATVQHSRTTALTATAGLIVNTSSVHVGRCSMTAVGSLQASGHDAHARAVSLNATANITGNGRVQHVRQVTLSAAGSLTASADDAHVATTAWAAAGSLTVAASVTHTRTADLAAIFRLVTASNVRHVSSTTLTAAGGVHAAAIVTRIIPPVWLPTSTTLRDPGATSTLKSVTGLSSMNAGPDPTADLSETPEPVAALDPHAMEVTLDA